MGKRGFTLIELMIMVAIFSILAAGVQMAAGGRNDREACMRAETDLDSLQDALRTGFAQNGYRFGTDVSTWPDNGAETLSAFLERIEFADMAVLVQKQVSRSKSGIRDPWNQEYWVFSKGTGMHGVFVAYCRDGTDSGVDVEILSGITVHDVRTNPAARDAPMIRMVQVQ